MKFRITPATEATASYIEKGFAKCFINASQTDSSRLPTYTRASRYCPLSHEVRLRWISYRNSGHNVVEVSSEYLKSESLVRVHNVQTIAISRKS
eukprot:scaffold465_cov383-Pavlova_lutheri.AAC.11